MDLKPPYLVITLRNANTGVTSYAGWDLLGSSRMYQTEQNGWRQPSPHHSKSFWKQGSSDRWDLGNYNNYQQ
jgi:hypothetical protein